MACLRNFLCYFYTDSDTGPHEKGPNKNNEVVHGDGRAAVAAGSRGVDDGLLGEGTVPPELACVR